tara:strand:- start:616 stop:1395 length:780 start_codon:yes stop_codon:yes gene_type:complete
VIKAKKSLGQNFLIDKTVLNLIADLINIEGKTILEVGPGTGNLTKFLLKKKPKKFFVVEKDSNLVLLLNKNFGEKITIFNQDILEIDENFICDDQIIVFGNLPYNISTKILSKWIHGLNEKKWCSHLVLMFQKEVADRITSKFNSSKYGRLSILANWKFEIKKIIDVKPNSFLPKPKIDSSILSLSPKKKFFKFKNSENLELITRTFFNQRRKMIKKPFNKLFKGKIDILKKLNITSDLRPQNLDFETYFKLTKEYENL